MHHPWRAFRDLVDWTLLWAHLPGDLLGLVDYDARTVTLDSRLTQAQRRCTIAHEAQHIRRGPAVRGWEARDEVEVDKAAARLLLPDVRVIGEALAWAHGMAEAADELWVDEATLRTRLEYLHPCELGYLRVRLAGVD